MTKSVLHINHYWKPQMMKLKYFALAVGLTLGVRASAQAADKRPNILIIWGDDIGQFNLTPTTWA